MTKSVRNFTVSLIDYASRLSIILSAVTLVISLTTTFPLKASGKKEDLNNTRIEDQQRTTTLRTARLTELNRSQIMEGINSDETIKEFLREFYHRLYNLNHSRTVTDESYRPVENRRLDAMARLLVGGETCAAVAFDGKNLLVSTNSNSHPSDRINVDVKLLLKKGSSPRNKIDGQFVYYISYNNNAKTVRVLGEDIAYNNINGWMIPERDIIKTSIPASLHMIPFLEGLPIDISQKLTTRFRCPDPHGLSLPEDVETDTPNKFNTLYSPLKRRAEVLIDHMSLIAQAKQHEELKYTPSHKKKKSKRNKTKANNPNNFREKLKIAIEQSRQRMLIQSLSWEATKWFHDLTPSKQKKINFNRETVSAEVNEFIEILNSKFEELRNSQTEGLLSSIRVTEWFTQMINDIKLNKIPSKIPDCIKLDPDLFMGRAWRYFIDLIKLEEFVRALDKENPLFEKLLEEKGPTVSKNLPKIVDDLKDGVHAEMRILWYTREKKVPYIATSLLCCAHCGVMMHGCNVQEISGRHGRAYDKWWFAAEFFRDTRFLKAFLGEKLHTQFTNFSESLNLSFGEISRQQFVIMAIERIANLTDNDLKTLGVTTSRVFAKGSMMADESDDESEEKTDDADSLDVVERGNNKDKNAIVAGDNELQQQSYVLRSIPRDGNCMYNAVLQGAQEALQNQSPSQITTVSELRTRVANEIETNYGHYFDELVTQLVTIVRDEDYFGLPKSMANKLKGLNKQFRKWGREGLTADEISEKLRQIIEKKGIIETYRTMISLNQTWGGNVELGIMSQILRIQIIVHREGNSIPINNSNIQNALTVDLEYDGSHYDLRIPNNNPPLVPENLSGINNFNSIYYYYVLRGATEDI